MPTSHLLEIRPNISHPSTPRSPQWSLSIRFPHQDPIHPLSSPIRATCPTHLILLEFLLPTLQKLSANTSSLGQLTGLQPVKTFPAFHGTPRFITAITRVRHPSLSWASPIQSTCPHPTSWRCILLSTHLRPRSPQWSLSILFPHQDPIHPPFLTHTRHMPSPSHTAKIFKMLTMLIKYFLHVIAGL